MLDTRPPPAQDGADAAADAGAYGARAAAERFFTRPDAVVTYKPLRRLAQAPAEGFSSSAPTGDEAPTQAEPGDRAPRVFRVVVDRTGTVDEPGEAEPELATALGDVSEVQAPLRRRRRLPDERRPGQVHHVVVAKSDAVFTAEAAAGEPVEQRHLPLAGFGLDTRSETGESYSGVCRALNDLQSTLQEVRHARQLQLQLRRLMQPAR